MKTLFGLLLLSGVLAVQESGKPQNVPCRLSVSDLVGGSRMSSITKMKSSALTTLILFLESQNLGIQSVVCVIEQFGDGYWYKVQYNGLNWVQIVSPLSDESQIIGKGVILQLTEQPF